jgi:hypothetical protein
LSRQLRFVLDENDDGSTSLLLRSRAAGAAGQLGLVDRLSEPGYLVLNWGMLLGIEQKAEGAWAIVEVRLRRRQSGDILACSVV